MPLVSKKIFNPTSKIAVMTGINENFQLKMDKIVSIAVAAALVEIRRNDGTESRERDPTKT